MGTLIAGGTLVDGTGAAGKRADVRITGRHVSEIGIGLSADGDDVIDARGAVVAPGFIDIHTHFDPTLFWDPTCDPMALHGVTTILYGSCGLSLAPVRPDRRAELTEVFCYIEDLPVAAFDAAIPWTWERYPAYLDAMAEGRYGLNVAGLVGHNPLRLFVMGDEAWERPATETERSRIAHLLDESLAAGAFGMSTSQGFDQDRTGRKVPSRMCDDAELSTLIDVLADRGRFLQFIADPHAKHMPASVRRVAELCAPRGLVNTWISVLHDDQRPDDARNMLDLSATLQAEGSPCYPQITPRSFDVQVNWDGGMSFMNMPQGWHRVVQASRPDKAPLLNDPTWRATARAEWDRTAFTMIRHHRPENIRLLSVTRPEHERWLNQTFDQLVAERGGHPSDVLADWVLDNDLEPGVVGTAIANGDVAGVAEMLVHPAGVIGNSDAGAHQQMFCAVGDTTLLLTRHVRDRGDLTIERAVHGLTGRLAGLFGFEGRGVVHEGAIADVTVFALDELHWDLDNFVSDLPAGGQRLRRPPGGYRATIVDGVVVAEHGEPTAARPGRLLRR